MKEAGEMSPRRIVITKILSFILSCPLTLAANIFITSEIESRLGIGSSLGQILILFAQLTLIYLILQFLIFRKLANFEKFLLAAAYAVIVFSGLFLRYPGSGFNLYFNGNQMIFSRAIGWNPLSFIFDAIQYPFSMLVNLINILLFLPLMPVLAINKCRPKWWVILVGFATIEFLQFFFNSGAFDLGDIVLYMIGYIAGLGILRIFTGKKPGLLKQKPVSE